MIEGRQFAGFFPVETLSTSNRLLCLGSDRRIKQDPHQSWSH